jgi:hypothetical protein
VALPFVADIVMLAAFVPMRRRQLTSDVSWR